MGFTGPLPSHILARLSPENRPKGPAGMTKEQAETAGEARLEIEHLHEPFRMWCAFHKLPFVNSRSDKAATIRKGWPDFTVMWQGRVCCIEFKRPGGKLRLDQEECRKDIEASGTPWMLATDVNAAIAFTKAALQFTPAE